MAPYDTRGHTRSLGLSGLLVGFGGPRPGRQSSPETPAEGRRLPNLRRRAWGVSMGVGGCVQDLKNTPHNPGSKQQAELAPSSRKPGECSVLRIHGGLWTLLCSHFCRL